MIFYQTSHTIQGEHVDSNKSIEVYLLYSESIAANRSIFEIAIQSDIENQLKNIKNLQGKVFAPVKKTMLGFVVRDGMGNVEINRESSKNVMSGNRNVYMANHIARVMNLATMHFARNSFDNSPEYMKYRPANVSVYAELFVSSFENDKLGQLWSL